LREDKIMSNRMKHVTLENYTKSEIEWLAEMVAEKLIEMGYEDIGSYAFSVEVDFEETDGAEG
jgi:hypothetical protein